MNTKNILAALLLMVSSSMMAEECLTITCNGTDESISLPTIQRITFEDNYLKVTTTDGAFLCPLSAVEKIYFSDSADAIETLPEQEENLTYQDGKLTVKGDGFLRIYSANGALVNLAKVKEGANVNLNNLPAGVYIVSMGDKTIKVKK